MAMNVYPTVPPAIRFGLVPGNRVTLLQNREAFFPAIENAFDRARFQIYLATYIYEDDATGQRIADGRSDMQNCRFQRSPGDR